MKTLEGVMALLEGGAGPEVFAVWVVLLKARVVVGVIVLRRSG
jgi:hypothetical protein